MKKQDVVEREPCPRFTMEEAVEYLADSDHVFLDPEWGIALGRPFGLLPKIETMQANVDIKGLMRPEEDTGKWFQGVSSEQLTGALCRHLGLGDSDLRGRGFRLRDEVKRLRAFLADAPAEPVALYRNADGVLTGPIRIGTKKRFRMQPSLLFNEPSDLHASMDGVWIDPAEDDEPEGVRRIEYWSFKEGVNVNDRLSEAASV